MKTNTYKEDLEAKRWCRYVPQHERPVLGQLIKLAIKQGEVSIYDGEEYAIRRSTEYAAIKCQLGHSGEDVLEIHNGEDYLGMFYLIYNNGSHDDPMIVICDYTDNAICNDIYNALSN